jgi:cytidylate kinase
LQKEDIMANKTAITISRQFGCGGAKIGQLVATKLGFHYADREVLHIAAKSLGLPLEEISWRDERPASFWDKITEVFTYGLPDVTYTAPPFRTVTDEHLFALEGKIIKELAEREDCVIVGRGGAHILMSHPSAVHIFLHAPVLFRIKRVMEVYGAATQEKAMAMIRETDRARKLYLDRMAKHDWFHANNYHLALDTSTLSLEQAANLIAEYTKIKTGC